MRCFSTGVALLALLACGGDVKPPADPATAIAQHDSITPSNPDSLALTTARGFQVWFTAARPDHDVSGHACAERALEIRHAGRRVPVPLLYTASAPRELDDSTIRAELWLHCAAGDSYRVDLRTGHPTPIRP